MTAPAVAPPAGTAADWLTPAEAAAELRVSDNTVIRWFHLGILPGLNEGTVYRLSAPFVASLKTIGTLTPVTVSAFARNWAARNATEVT